MIMFSRFALLLLVSLSRQGLGLGIRSVAQGPHSSSSSSASVLVGRQRPSSSSCWHQTTALAALTERQVQFWEDVDDGLNDIEQFYEKKSGQDIDRIRQFSKSAQGKVPPPQGYAPGHAPSEEHVEGLTAKPFWNATDEPLLFPWASRLEAEAHVIREEFQAKLLNNNINARAGGGGSVFASDSVWQNQVMGTGWSAIRLQRLGVWNTENCAKFPKTYELLRSLNIPLAVRGVCFARQAPKSGVQPHSDGRNFILTSHLGLQIPDGCWMQSGDERRGWEAGKLTTLDTSFTHSTGNPSDSDRHVLIIDYWHPELTEAERSALDFIYDLRNKFESGRIPFRKPRSMEQEGGLAALWTKVTGG
jgi:Aspartyl/Asparaginyl beta-hydroxylase